MTNINTKNSLLTMSPTSVSIEQEKWNQTAEGLLARLLAEIRAGQTQPREMIIIYLDRLDGDKTLHIEQAKTRSDVALGLIELSKSRILDEAFL